MKIKNVCSGVLTLILLLSVTFGVQAATREEIAAIQVKTAADFRYWNEDSPTLK